MSLSVLDASAEAPNEIALVSGSRCVSYSELGQRVGRLIAGLKHDGVVVGSSASAEPVAVEGSTDLVSVELLLALITAGVPAAVMHPRWTPTERDRWLETTRVSRVLTPQDLAPTPSPVTAVVRRVADDDRPLCILATSGTTQNPRAVVLSRRAFVASANGSAQNLGWTPEDRWLANLPLAHVGGLSVLTRCLLARRTAVLASATSATELAAVVEQQRITLLSLVPPLLDRLLDLGPTWKLPQRVRAILVGGAPLPDRLRQGAVARGWPVLATYGLTEACSQVTVQRYGGPGLREPGAGTALPGTDIRVLDGRIQIRGPTLFSGYLPLGRHPHPGPDGWFDTGDLGRLDDSGRLHVLGRQDELIVTGGENVSPGEVEAALQACPGVADACVFALPSEQWGQLVAAAIVQRPNDSTPRDVLIAPAREHLAPYKLPRQVAFVRTLEVGPNGKVDRRATARKAIPRLQKVH